MGRRAFLSLSPPPESPIHPHAPRCASSTHTHTHTHTQPAPAATYQPVPFALGCNPTDVAAGLSTEAQMRGGGGEAASACQLPPPLTTAAGPPGGLGGALPPPLPAGPPPKLPQADSPGLYGTPRHVGHHHHQRTPPPEQQQHPQNHPPCLPPPPDTPYDLANALLRDLHFDRLRRVGVGEGGGEGQDED